MDKQYALSGTLVHWDPNCKESVAKGRRDTYSCWLKSLNSASVKVMRTDVLERVCTKLDESVTFTTGLVIKAEAKRVCEIGVLL